MVATCYRLLIYTRTAVRVNASFWRETTCAVEPGQMFLARRTEASTPGSSKRTIATARLIRRQAAQGRARLGRAAVRLPIRIGKKLPIAPYLPNEPLTKCFIERQQHSAVFANGWLRNLRRIEMPTKNAYPIESFATRRDSCRRCYDLPPRKVRCSGSDRLGRAATRRSCRWLLDRPGLVPRPMPPH